MLNRLKDDAAAEGKPSPARQASLGRSRPVVARLLRQVLSHGALGVLGVYRVSVDL